METIDIRKYTDAERAAMAVRLRECRETAGFKRAVHAAEKHGWTYPTYASHEKGTRGFKLRDALIYAAAFKTTADYLLTGNLNSISLNDGQLLEIFRGIRRIPLLKISDLMTFKRISTGEIPTSPAGESEPLPTAIAAGPRAFALRVFDKAMAGSAPSLELGYIAYFDPDIAPVTGNIVAALIDGYPILALRKYREMVGEGGQAHFDLVAANEDFPSFSSAKHNINLVGRLIGIWMPV